jgi:hypothetical protein
MFNVNRQYIADYLVYNNWNSCTEEANGETVSVNIGYCGDSYKTTVLIDQSIPGPSYYQLHK